MTLKRKRIIEYLLIAVEVVFYVLAAVDIFVYHPDRYASPYLVIGIAIFLGFGVFEGFANKALKKQSK